MILLKDTKIRFAEDVILQSQFQNLFGNIETYIEEFNPFWESLLPQSIQAHSRSGMGDWAGAGCVDYTEALALHIFVRILKPQLIIELGYAGGISTSFLAHALSQNQTGIIHTVDLSPEYWDVCDMFQQYKNENIIIQHHSTDAYEFLKECSLAANLTFSDATHDKEPTAKIASLLRDKWPNITHLYHEWGMSKRSNNLEQSYVSFTSSIGLQYERDAFEETFGADYRHGGICGSCGLGIVMPI